MEKYLHELLAEASHHMRLAADRIAEALAYDCRDTYAASRPENPNDVRSTLGGYARENEASILGREEIREKEQIYYAGKQREEDAYREGIADAQSPIGNSRPLNLVVTLDGVPFEDQALGLRLFKEACGIHTTKAQFSTAGADRTGRNG